MTAVVLQAATEVKELLLQHKCFSLSPHSHWIFGLMFSLLLCGGRQNLGAQTLGRGPALGCWYLGTK